MFLDPCGGNFLAILLFSLVSCLNCNCYVTLILLILLILFDFIFYQLVDLPISFLAFYLSYSFFLFFLIFFYNCTLFFLPAFFFLNFYLLRVELLLTSSRVTRKSEGGLCESYISASVLSVFGRYSFFAFQERRWGQEWEAMKRLGERCACSIKWPG